MFTYNYYLHPFILYKYLYFVLSTIAQINRLYGLASADLYERYFRAYIQIFFTKTAISVTYIQNFVTKHLAFLLWILNHVHFNNRKYFKQKIYARKKAMFALMFCCELFHVFLFYRDGICHVYLKFFVLPISTRSVFHVHFLYR